MDNTTHQTFEASNTLRWLFFDLNSYFASVEQQQNPALRGKPVAVIPTDTDATCAIAASYEAKAYGVKTGTKIYDAKKICPDLQCVLARHDLYVEYHQRIFKEVENHIPITKKCSIDEAACQLLQNEQNPETARRIAHNIKQGLKNNIGEYIKCSIGIAPNMFLAKTATDMQKPDGLIILPPNNYKERLFKMRLGDLCGIGQNIEKRLHHAGIQTIEQLWNISPKHARKIWGNVSGEIFWYRLHGYDIPDKPTQKRVVGHSRVLDPQFRPQDKAYSMALTLTIKACARLRRYNLYAKNLSLSVRTTQQFYWADDWSFPPTQDNFTIKQALDRLWHQMNQKTRQVHLKKISVCLHDLYEGGDITLDLFDTIKTQPPHQQLSATMDKINNRFGSNSVNFISHGFFYIL